MKHQFYGSHTVFEGDVQSLKREKLDENRMKLSLLHQHIFDGFELLMPTGNSWIRPHTAYCAIAKKLLCNNIAVYHGVIRAGRATDCV